MKRRDPDRTLSYAEHLSELRRRLLVSALAVVAASVAAYSFRDALVDLVRRPVADVPFVFLDPPELFLANIKIAVLAGLVVAAPFIFFQIWMFVRPGLKSGERITVALAILFGTLFFAAGALFGYLVVLPMTLRFFLQYETGAIRASLSFGRYVGFLTSLLLAFGLAFELPMLVLVLARLGIVDAPRLARWRKYALLAILIVAAIFTPPDVVSQLLLAGPMLVLYEISIFVARLARRPADPPE